MQLVVFVLGALLLAGALRLWRGLAPATLLAYLGLVLAFFARPLLTSAIQVPTDLAYQWRPWSEAAPRGLVVQNGLLSDVPLQMLPFRSLVRQRWLSFSLPLWANEIGTGEPLLGNAQSAPFAPLHLLALPLPPLRALTVAVAWQLYLALLLTHALLAQLGAGGLGRVLGAIVFAFSPFEIAWAYYPLGMTTAFLPGLVLGLLLLRRGERGGFSGTVACGLGVLLSGHPETAAQLGAACAALAAVLLAQRAGVSRARFAAQAGAAALVLACLSAPALLPALDALTESARWRAATGTGTGEPGQPAGFDPRPAAALLDPLRFGSPRDQNYAGPEGGSVNFNDVCGSYAGLVPLAAALAGLALGARRRLPLVAGGGLALAVALRVPPLDQVVARLPGLGLAPAGRWRVVFVLAVAVAAGLAVDELVASRRGRLLLAGALLLGCGSLALLPPAGGEWQLAWWIATLAGAAGAAVALVSGLDARLLGGVLLGAVLADLWLLGYRYNPTLPASFDLRPPTAIAALAADSRGRRAPFRVLAELDDLEPNLGALYGLWDVRGNDPMLPARASLVVGRAIQRHYRVGQPLHLVLRDRRPPLLDYLGVRYLLLRRRAHLPPPWRVVWEEPGQSLWRNDQALDLFFMPARVLVVASAGEVLPRVLRNPDFREVAILERPRSSERSAPSTPSVPTAPPATVGALTRIEPRARSAPPAAVGASTRIEPRANGFDLELASATGGLVASSVSFARGWRAEVDGREIATCEVNGGFLGFPVTPGIHRVRIRYRPPHGPMALALAALGLVVLVAKAASVRRRRD
jgi:membrane protein YfhO